MQLGIASRVKAAAQHSSSELGSAFTLHFPCNVNEWDIGPKPRELTKREQLTLSFENWKLKIENWALTIKKRKEQKLWQVK